MAHYAKYKIGAVGVMARHFERRKDANGEYVRFGNQDIELSRTHINYNLGPKRSESQAQYLHRRCGEVKCLKRGDVTMMCSWIVTAPKELPKADNEQFFQAAYGFLQERYGGKDAENVVSAYVHMDEQTPHMHFAFVPVTADKKTGQLKVAASELVTRQDLKTFHGDLEKRMAFHFGRNVGILNEATKEGNKSIEEMKRGTAAEAVRNALNLAQNELAKVEGLQEQKKALQAKIEDMGAPFGERFFETKPKKGFGLDSETRRQKNIIERQDKEIKELKSERAKNRMELSEIKNDLQTQKTLHSAFSAAFREIAGRFPEAARELENITHKTLFPERYKQDKIEEKDMQENAECFLEAVQEPQLTQEREYEPQKKIPEIDRQEVAHKSTPDNPRVCEQLEKDEDEYEL